MFEIIEKEEVSSDWGTVIKVIGVGGAAGERAAGRATGVESADYHGILRAD